MQDTYRPPLAADLDTERDAILAELPPALAERVHRLVIRVEDAAQYAALRADDETWHRVLAHVPGLAPALELIRLHCEGALPACAAPGHPAPCSLPPLDPAAPAA
jgi:hypothetical protein